MKNIQRGWATVAGVVCLTLAIGIQSWRGTAQAQVGLEITKECNTLGTNFVSVSGFVKNTSLTNTLQVIVIDDRGTPENSGDDIVVLDPTPIPPGQTSGYARTFTLPLTCDAFNNTVTAIATNTGSLVTATASDICELPGALVGTAAVDRTQRRD